MQRRELAQTIATSLFETEAALDAALEKAALLIAQTSAMRREHNYSAVLGHEAIAALTRTVDSLGAAREHAMTAHAAFEKASPALGVRPTTLQGTGVDKPANFMVDGGEANVAELRPIATAA